MSPLWHLLFWVMLPASLWIALWAYGEVGR
jgi:hypothetical protein